MTSAERLFYEIINGINDSRNGRESAVPKPKLSPGYYDDKDYHYEDEESFVREAFERELAQIRLQREKQQFEKKHNDNE